MDKQTELELAVIEFYEFGLEQWLTLNRYDRQAIIAKYIQEKMRTLHEYSVTLDDLYQP